LDFHHTEPKKTNKKVHKLVSDGHTKIRIQKEIEKCVVLCSNCHRVHHEEERKNKRKIVATSLK
jgi:tryptophanyl-tRNA synthetase